MCLILAVAETHIIPYYEQEEAIAMEYKERPCTKCKKVVDGFAWRAQRHKSQIADEFVSSCSHQRVSSTNGPFIAD